MACRCSKKSPKSSFPPVRTSPSRKPPRVPCTRTATRPRAQNFRSDAPPRPQSPALQSSTRVARFRDSSSFPCSNQPAQFLQPREQLRQLSERQRVRAVRERLARIVVRLQENAVHSRRHRCPRQRLNKLRLSPRSVSLPSRQLHRMRRVENHRIAQPLEDRNASHVHHKIVIPEGRPAL